MLIALFISIKLGWFIHFIYILFIYCIKITSCLIYQTISYSFNNDKKQSNHNLTKAIRVESISLP